MAKSTKQRVSNQETTFFFTIFKCGFVKHVLSNAVFFFLLFSIPNSSFAQSQMDNEENDPDMPAAFGKSLGITSGKLRPLEL